MQSQNVRPFAFFLLVAANLAIPLAIVTFAKGFFPYKPMFPGLAQYDNTKYGPPPTAPFDRLVFMVVDALRSDFVYTANSGFKFTQSLIRDGTALPFTAHATSPTVTMPRIKAITTGSIPSFLDVILNIDEGDKSSSLASQDTWLAQMKAKATGKLVLFGDDTWLKLFPDTFDRADGTSSFFVADFTEVDNNVTRHIADELKHDDWNTMVLHYLGLDHIGHKGGPRSPNMLPKQREMDDIVKEIYTSISSQKHLQSTILVLCGDHGMNDAGNHGGSSAGETSPALVFISPKLKQISPPIDCPTDDRDDFQYYSTIEQSDLAPTLGALLGFPVPKNNLGALLPDFLRFWPDYHDKTQLLMRNAHQILGIMTAAFGTDLLASKPDSFPCSEARSDAETIACEWHRIVDSLKGQELGGVLDDTGLSTLSAWLQKAQRVMGSMASNYDMSKLALGQTVAVVAVLFAVTAACFSSRSNLNSFIPFTIITLGYGLMMFASSYVEEEHHFWYWSSAAYLCISSFQGLQRGIKSKTSHASSLMIAFSALRLVRGWNQTGQKFAGEPDLVKLFLHTNPILLWILVSITYLWIHRELVRGFDGLPMALNVAGTTSLILAAFSFKLAFTNEDSPELVTGFARTFVDLTQGANLVSRARAVFIGLGVGTACVLYCIVTKRNISCKASPMENLQHLYTLLAVTQSRATNIPLFLLFDILYKYLSAQDLTLVDLTTATLLLQFTSYFAFGGTNAISSVDLSSAYNGISGFNVGAVGLLTFISNWAGPIYWTFATNVLLIRKWKTGERNVYFRHITILSMFTTASVAFVMAACMLLRTHLFIWTVFSPKYLYCMAWSLGMHIGVNITLGGILYWLGTL